MIDGVLHQLVQHDRERRCDLTRQLARVAVDAEPDAQLRRRSRVLDQAGERPHDLAEVHDVARLARQGLVHDRDRPDATLGLGEGRPRFGRTEPPGLEPQQRRDRLQVVLHPVMDLADRRVLRQQHPVPAAEVADVTHQDHRADGLAAVEQRQDLREHGDVAAFELLGHGQPGDASRRACRRRRSRRRRAAAPARRCGCPCGATSSRRSGSRTARACPRRSTITPSPTRGALSTSISSTGRRGTIPRRSSSRNGRTLRGTRARARRSRRVKEIGDSWVSSRDRAGRRAASGCTCTRTRSFDPSAAVSPSTISPVRQQRVEQRPFDFVDHTARPGPGGSWSDR